MSLPLHAASTRRALLLRVCAYMAIAGSAAPVHAHDFSAGQLVIDHPYATPTVAAASTGAVYFRAITNNGAADDRLLHAHTAIATRVAIHRMQLEDGVMRMREVDALVLPAQRETRMRHGQTDCYHLMLEGLNAPLTNGRRFDLHLQFEKAGARTVKVWVQRPKNAHTNHYNHQH